VRPNNAITFSLVWLAIFIAHSLPAQTSLPALGDSFAVHHTQVKLLLSADTAKPGDTIFAGVDLKMEPGWHTYWKNPGDAGSPTKIEWTLPPGISAGEIQWPLPKKLPPAEVTTYGYEDEVALIVPLKVEAKFSTTASPIDLKAKVAWLECKESCIPADANIAAKLNVGSETKSSADAAIIDLWKSKVPPAKNDYSLTARWEKPAAGNTRPLLIGSSAPMDATKNISYDSVDFYPDANDNYEVQSATEIISAFSSDIRLRKNVKKNSGDWPNEISGTLVIEDGKLRFGYEVKLPIADQTPVSSGAIRSGTSVSSAQTGRTPVLLWQMLLYAFIGGLILNIMPCVLPVIALKILSFVSEAKSSPRRVRALGGIYAIGVLFSFLVLAAVVIGVKAAGHQAGWGMQFGSPIFLVCLTTLIMLVALNLFGVFEVTLGGGALNTAGELASRHGPAGAFFNGVLATMLATPCTAPFLSLALGFAFAQSAAVIVLVFLTVGLGLSAPYVLLSWNPAWLKFLPKPGAWMEKFKIAMGFPMLATVVWLFNVAASSYGKNVMWLGVFLVIVAFAAWIFGEFVQRGRNWKMVAVIGTILLLLGGYTFALEKELNWRAPFSETDATGSLKESVDGIDWQRWSPEAVVQARAAGKVVLVDFTADWCLTCQVNKKTSLEISSVREKLKLLNAIALMGDYTHFPAAITTELQRFNRAGVPLVLVYPKKSDAPPRVLPEVLTPSLVLGALDRAAN
jgi:thiol:disulfide interchange protein DsbD